MTSFFSYVLGGVFGSGSGEPLVVPSIELAAASAGATAQSDHGPDSPSELPIDPAALHDVAAVEAHNNKHQSRGHLDLPERQAINVALENCSMPAQQTPEQLAELYTWLSPNAREFVTKLAGHERLASVPRVWVSDQSGHMWTNNLQIEKAVGPACGGANQGAAKFVSLDKLADRVAVLFEGAVSGAAAYADQAHLPPAHLVLSVHVSLPPPGRPASEANAMIYFKALTFRSDAIVAQAH
ncbi:uncharacterized protein ACA1_324910 [Acanthamoeba castellanii str. Neff]|uniref:DUF5860 domain-containing protein n=1 Tax=Acanthamoeba castellanii (strain ATCC 30010 / Neff) TaxID=1257118 RepID=L8GHV6_ACACF|nr:uncharacterized protein ACA1_324910 [Acanthamoeba castellanii str. Neff]ELR12444.1 hypothetical protein ACA1_324910 [Acanthamoeba castellanii str. Neff]